ARWHRQHPRGGPWGALDRANSGAGERLPRREVDERPHLRDPHRDSHLPAFRTARHADEGEGMKVAWRRVLRLDIIFFGIVFIYPLLSWKDASGEEAGLEPLLFSITNTPIGPR